MINKLEKAEEQIYSEQQEVSYDTRELTIEYLVDKYMKGIENEDNELFVPDYQRDFVWEEERQAKFIESVILGLPIPFIFVAEIKDSGRLEIVDGSQRIRTLAAFLNNELKLKKLEKLTLLNNVKFSELSIPRQRKIRNIPIRMIVLTDKASEQVRNDMFERINRGSELLKDMEKRKGIYKGSFNDFIYEICEKESKFKKLTPIVKWLKNRQELQELVLRFFALSDHYQHYPSGTGISKFLDNYLETKNKNFTEKEKETRLRDFRTVVNFVEKNFEYGFAKSNVPQVSRVYFEAIAVGVLMALKDNPQLKTSKVETSKWIKSKAFNEVIAGKYETHSPRRIKERIEFVRNALNKK
ncbi:hypothetical protein FCR2A7T_07210 [Flavobacterium cauense R2A-7]|uniref:Uncharacterized protein DUF262 n=1 Tax=Flavobacterium cauense R2A-7 TaxID=1341154 RepID=V6S2M5_9FLAO|nr:DUF262 domain-containing protein [Flavobacterium cauense]ESU20951.1 hypothetical protein FCR2A7T_07210 [Flavobacterium cauense R2A-7]KGO79629.1 hypothetical protein Q762_14125 [Flavobacterium cauense R2A-7]TWI08378.1 uncharacterized protein DUF262 [Flavobacterium cauense R2A-7]